MTPILTMFFGAQDGCHPQRNDWAWQEVKQHQSINTWWFQVHGMHLATFALQPHIELFWISCCVTTTDISRHHQTKLHLPFSLASPFILQLCMGHIYPKIICSNYSCCPSLGLCGAEEAAELFSSLTQVQHFQPAQRTSERNKRSLLSPLICEYSFFLIGFCFFSLLGCDISQSQRRRQTFTCKSQQKALKKTFPCFLELC